LWALRRKVEEYSGLPVGATEPIIGHNVFSHETGIHTAGITIHPAIYQVIEPDAGGGELRFLFGKLSGAVGIDAILERIREPLELAAALSLLDLARPLAPGRAPWLSAGFALAVAVGILAVALLAARRGRTATDSLALYVFLMLAVDGVGQRLAAAGWPSWPLL